MACIQILSFGDSTMHGSPFGSSCNAPSTIPTPRQADRAIARPDCQHELSGRRRQIQRTELQNDGFDIPSGESLDGGADVLRIPFPAIKIGNDQGFSVADVIKLMFKKPTLRRKPNLDCGSSQKLPHYFYPLHKSRERESNRINNRKLYTHRVFILHLKNNFREINMLCTMAQYMLYVENHRINNPLSNPHVNDVILSFV
jgi:hypothetical protein